MVPLVLGPGPQATVILGFILGSRTVQNRLGRQSTAAALTCEKICSAEKDLSKYQISRSWPLCTQRWLGSKYLKGRLVAECTECAVLHMGLTPAPSTSPKYSHYIPLSVSSSSPFSQLCWPSPWYRSTRLVIVCSGSPWIHRYRS